MDTFLKGWVVALATCAGAGCGTDDCSTLPSAFELEVQLDVDGDRPSLGSLRVVMRAEEDRWWRLYDVSNVFEDNRTSLAVELVPARERPTPITLELTLFSGPDGTGSLLARREQTFELTGNACNAFSMELEISNG